MYYFAYIFYIIKHVNVTVKKDRYKNEEVIFQNIYFTYWIKFPFKMRFDRPHYVSKSWFNTLVTQRFFSGLVLTLVSCCVFFFPPELSFYGFHKWNKEMLQTFQIEKVHHWQNIFIFQCHLLIKQFLMKCGY